jgi:hypothetical protein
MSRWTANRQEYDRLRRVVLKAPITSLALIELRSGRTVEGYVLEFPFERHVDGFNFRGELHLKHVDHSVSVIDMLDVTEMHNVWEQKCREYINAGIIDVHAMQSADTMTKGMGGLRT